MRISRLFIPFYYLARSEAVAITSNSTVDMYPNDIVHPVINIIKCYECSGKKKQNKIYQFILVSDDRRQQRLLHQTVVEHALCVLREELLPSVDKIVQTRWKEILFCSARMHPKTRRRSRAKYSNPQSARL